MNLKVREADSAILAARAELAKAEAAVRGHSVQVSALEREWKAKQKAAYVLAFPDKDPSTQPKIDTLPKNPSTAAIGN